MTCKSLVTLALAASTALALSTAASAEGKTDQARKAIAAAQAKIDATNIVGAAGDAPRLHAEAVSTLHMAQDELNHHDKEAAIRDATHASEIADRALAVSQHTRNEQQQATTAAAQEQASDANARAAAAQAAAAAAQADAAAARAAPPIVIAAPAPAPAPAPTATSVTTTQTDVAATTDTAEAKPTVAKRHVAKRRVVQHHRHPAVHKTTTTVTTG